MYFPFLLYHVKKKNSTKMTIFFYFLPKLKHNKDMEIPTLLCFWISIFIFVLENILLLEQKLFRIFLKSI